MGGGASKKTGGEVQVANNVGHPTAAVISAEGIRQHQLDAQPDPPASQNQSQNHASQPPSPGSHHPPRPPQVHADQPSPRRVGPTPAGKPKASPEQRRPQVAAVRRTKDKPGDANEDGEPLSPVAASPPIEADPGLQEAPAAGPPVPVPPSQEALPARPPVAPGSPSRPEVTVQEFLQACREANDAVVKAFLVSNARAFKGLAEREEALFDDVGDSVLHHAVKSGNEKVVELLLDLGRLQADLPNARNETALQFACRQRDEKLVAILLQAQADPNRSDSAGLTPFLAALFAGCSESLLESLFQAKANVGVQDARGVGALHFAALRGDSQLMGWLLQKQASPDVQTEHSTTPLMLAIKRDHVEGVSLLLQARANVSLADEAGCTALMHALSGGNVKVAELLLDSGASVDVVDGAGRTPLFHATMGGQIDAIRLVVARGGRVNILDEEGRSPLYQACLMSDLALAKCLLDADADPNLAGRGSAMRPTIAAKEEDGAEDDEASSAAKACLEEARSCLQVCATLGHNELLVVLLEQGADINAAPGVLGWTSLHLCAAVCNEEGAELLLSRGAILTLEDAEGNTPEVLATRAGHEAVLQKLHKAAAEAPAEADPLAASGVAKVPTPSNSRRPVILKGSLPPLHAAAPPMTEEAPEEELEPLALFQEEWPARESDGSLLDATVGPMVVDALKSEHWRLRWEALCFANKNFASVAGTPDLLARCVAELLAIGAKDKMPKVFLAAIAVFDTLLTDSRSDSLGPEEFASALHGKEGESNALTTLLEQTDAAGGSSSAASFQQAAADALSSSVLHGRVPLDEVAFPLLGRIEERLVAEASGDAGKDRKDKALGPKCLASNLKLVCRLLSAFGLQQSGLFRRALVLPLLLRAACSEHSKVRAVAGDALVQILTLSGGIEDRIWQLLPSKVRKAVQRLGQEHEGLTLMAAVPSEEDVVKREVLVAEDSRAGNFICVSELNAQVWAALADKLEANGKRSTKKRSGSSSAKERASPQMMPSASAIAAAAASVGFEDEAAAEALRAAIASKAWKERVDAVQRLTSELSMPNGEGVKCLEEREGQESSSGPLLAQYVLRGHRIGSLQAYLTSLLADSVTQVFCSAADLLRIVCGHVPLYIAPLFLEPLLPPLVARLIDTSSRVRSKASESALEIASMHGCALSEMIAQCVASGSAWSGGASMGAGAASSSTERAPGRDLQTGPRLQLLSHLVQSVQDNESAGRWTEETWQALADYAVKAAEHKSGDVRKEAATVINSLAASGGIAAAIADRAVTQLQTLASQAKMQKRPGTMSTRPPTGSTRMGTAAGSRPGTGAALLNVSGRMSNLGSTGGFSMGMGSTGRLSTASKRSGTGFRPGTGLNTGLRPGTGLSKARDVDEESDNSVHSDTEPAVEAVDESPPDDGEGVKFFDVKTSCPGTDEVITLEEGETALREALPLAEPLDEVAWDFVAPLVAFFGDGWTRCFYSRQWQCRVAALTHLSASMPHRLEAISGPEVSPNALGELLDASMRAVHEGLGDQNVRVYAEACVAVNHVVPAFCGSVDGRLLVAHLAPLLRQLCSRMGDSKEAVRLQTVQALFRLLRPPTGNIVSPIAIGMLILRHMAPAKDKEESSSGPSNDKGARVGWLCRIGALRDLIKEYTKSLVHQPGSYQPGEWLRLKDGLAHGDDLVRYETARLYALICKAHLRSLGGEEAQREGREAWVAALPKETTPQKSLSQVKKLLKLPDENADLAATGGSNRRGFGASGKLAPTTTSMASSQPWEVPMSLSIWAGCAPEALDALRQPLAGDEKPVALALRTLGKATAAFAEVPNKKESKPEEAFANICRAIQHALSSIVGGDRSVFLTSVELCQLSVTQLAPVVSGLDINMGLTKMIPTLLERTAITAGADVKVGVSSDKLMQQLAKHPKVGAEAVTKMVISAIARTECVSRPLVLLRTLLGDFGLRLCAQKDVVSLLLSAVGHHLERLAAGSVTSGEDPDAVRTQLVGVLATVSQFSKDTVNFCLTEVEPSQRRLLAAAITEAPNPKLVALGATAAEQAEVQHVAGSAVRAASRDRRGHSPGQSPKPGDDPGSPLVQGSPQGRRRGGGGSGSSCGLPRPPEDNIGSQLPGNISRNGSFRQIGEAAGSGSVREASPRSHSRKNRRVFRDMPQQVQSSAMSSDCGSESPSASPPLRNGISRHASAGTIGSGGSPGLDFSKSAKGPSRLLADGARPPAPLGLSTRLGSGADPIWESSAPAASSQELKRVHRSGSSDARFLKGKEGAPNDGLNSLMDVSGLR